MASWMGHLSRRGRMPYPNPSVIGEGSAIEDVPLFPEELLQSISTVCGADDIYPWNSAIQSNERITPKPWVALTSPKYDDNSGHHGECDHLPQHE
jgi:hypothetical protein